MDVLNIEDELEGKVIAYVNAVREVATNTIYVMDSIPGDTIIAETPIVLNTKQQLEETVSMFPYTTGMLKIPDGYERVVLKCDINLTPEEFANLRCDGRVCYCKAKPEIVFKDIVNPWDVCINLIQKFGEGYIKRFDSSFLFSNIYIPKEDRWKVLKLIRLNMESLKHSGYTMDISITPYNNFIIVDLIEEIAKGRLTIGLYGRVSYSIEDLVKELNDRNSEVTNELLHYYAETINYSGHFVKSFCASKYFSKDFFHYVLEDINKIIFYKYYIDDKYLTLNSTGYDVQTFIKKYVLYKRLTADDWGDDWYIEKEVLEELGLAYLLKNNNEHRV